MSKEITQADAVRIAREHLGTAQAFAGEVRKQMRTMRKLTDEAAQQAGMALVPMEVLAAYEQLYASIEAADKTAAITRDYKDAVQNGQTTYNGKRYVIGRHEGGEVYAAMLRCKEAKGK